MPGNGTHPTWARRARPSRWEARRPTRPPSAGRGTAAAGSHELLQRDPPPPRKERGPEVSHLADSPRQVVDAEIGDLRATLDLVPGQGRGDGRLLHRADRVDRCERAPPGIL